MRERLPGKDGRQVSDHPLWAVPPQDCHGMVALQSSNQCLFFETTSNNLQPRLDQSPSDHFHLVEKRLVSPFLPLTWRCDAYIYHYSGVSITYNSLVTPFLPLSAANL